MGLVPLVLACGTPEYRAERSVCEAEWVRKIPPRLERQLVERVRYIEVPTGRTTCTTTNTPTGAVQNCVSQTRTEAIPYTTVETVDVNAPRRDVQIRACAAQACSRKFGNPECKPAG
jgi:hypothetical protein